jgi:FAD/FMN-containing dehydrogenase
VPGADGDRLALERLVIATEALAPVDREEAAALIASPAYEHFWLRGNATRSGLIANAAPEAVTLSTHRLSRIVEYRPADLTVTVEAGCRLGELQSALGAAGQFLPVDYPSAGTVGGLVATAATDPRALGYGSIRERLLGVTAITSAGRITRSGSRVVKSVSGFDLHRLYCGSFGTLALIVEATFKLAPLPARTSVLAYTGSRRSISHFAKAALASHLRPTSLVALADDDEVGELVIVVEGSAARVERLSREIHVLAREMGLKSTETDPVPEAAGANFVPSVTLQLDVAVSRRLFISPPPVATRVVADLGTGRVIIELASELDGETLASIEAWMQTGDSLLYRGAGEPIRRRRLDPAARELARRLKRAFDPEDRFNRQLLEKLT